MDSNSLKWTSRTLWTIINILFGAFFAIILFFWVACDMKMPLIILDVVSTYAPWCLLIFDVPYIQVNLIKSSIVGKLLVNGILYGLFAFLHTLLAQEWIHEKITKILLPRQAMRTAYCVSVSCTAYMLMGFWQHTSIELWNFLPQSIDEKHKHFILLIFYNILFSPGFENQLRDFREFLNDFFNLNFSLVRTNWIRPIRILWNQTTIR